MQFNLIFFFHFPMICQAVLKSKAFPESPSSGYHLTANDKVVKCNILFKIIFPYFSYSVQLEINFYMYVNL